MRKLLILTLITGLCRIAAFAQQIVAPLDQVFVNEDLVAPFFNRSVDLQGFTVGGRTHEFGMNLQQRSADDAGGFNQLAPGLNTALHEKIQRGCIHPLGKIREEHNAGGIAIA